MLSGPNSGPTSQGEIWVPYTMLGNLRPDDEYFADPRAQWLAVVGRRAPDYSLRQVQQEMSLLAHAADERVPGRVSSLLVTDGSLIRDPEIRPRAPVIFAVTLGVSGMLLLLACVNVTSLLLSLSSSRQQEIAVRLSLGAGRFRLLRQLLTESLLLSGIAAAFSLLIAHYAPNALWNSMMSSPAPFSLMPDWRVVLYCLGVALAAGVIAGLSPAVETLRPRLSESLKGSAAAVTPGRRRSRFRSVLVAAQIALSLLLLVFAALFTQAQRRFFSYDPGFETRHVLNVNLASVLAGYNPPTSFYQEFESRINAAPGIVHGSYASIAPWSGRNSTELTSVDGKPIPSTHDFRRDPARRSVSPEYFADLDISFVRGRAFTREEATSKRQIVPVVISDAMARRYWPNQDPVGHHFAIPTLHQVIGVCRDVQSVAYMENDGAFYYTPLDADRAKPPYLLVRFTGDPQAATAAIRNVLRRTDPQMAAGIQTLAAIIERQGERLKPVMILDALAGILALLLAVTGVYGVVSFSVSQRVREIGIRLALGAQRSSVVSLVIRSGAAPVCCGIIVGIGLAVAVASATQATVFGFNPRDPLTFTLVPLLLLAAAFGAIWIPARRAARQDPMSALRNE